jgi:hypothetical protein
MSAKPPIRGGDKPEAFLEAWRLVSTDISYHLIGYVLGHVRFPDGQLVVTSDLVDVHVFPDRPVHAETLNTVYALGDRLRAELPEEYRELLDEILGEKWQSVPFVPSSVQ